MNEEFYKRAMRRIETITTDELRMIAIMEGLQWAPYTLTESRNQREGHYAGSYLGKHYRNKGDWGVKAREAVYVWHLRNYR